VKTKSSMRGVTLIELMTVIVIIAILGSVAVSSYQNSIRRSHRADAKIALMTIKVEQEKFFLQNMRYAKSTELTTATGLNLKASTEHGYYTVAISNTDTTNFTDYSATATATGGQAQDTDCSTFTVKSDGSQTAKKNGGTVNNACWK
jgi:type IV pilus assembly protein PilE